MQNGGRVHKHHAVLVREGARLVELGAVKRDGLLAQHVLARGERLAQVRDMCVVGRSDVNRIDARVCIELIVGFVHALNAIALGKCPRLLDRAVGNACKRTPGERHDLCHLVCNYTAADNRPAQLGRREDILGERLRANTRERSVGCSGGVERGGNLIGHVLLLLHGDERDDRRQVRLPRKTAPLYQLKPA